MSKRVYLHVGTPKTGTSYFQDVLFRNRLKLAMRGTLYPAERFDAHFLASLDLLRITWGGLEAEAFGAWDAMAKTVRSTPGTAIISHEILATASRGQAERALDSLGHGSGTEIHLVVSARDLARQIPAEWQENVKHRARVSYRRFLQHLHDPDRSHRIGSWFWAVQELPDILDRWAEHLPKEHVHVITVPPRGTRRDLLWERFSEVFPLDGLDLDTDRDNPSLGAAETALIRRINRRTNAELAPVDYRPLVRELLAHRVLSRRTDSPRLTLPPDEWPWVNAVSRSWVDELRRREYDVVGDLDDLLGEEPPRATYVDPDRPGERKISAAGIDAIKALLLENARLRHEEARLATEVRETQEALERAYLRPAHRAARKLVTTMENGAPGRLMLRGYRRARGRSSRPA